MKLNENTKTNGFLDPEKDPRDNGPAWRGHLNVDGAKVEIVAFDKISEAGRPYLSLSVGTRDERQYGALIPATAKKSDKSPDYFGDIEIDGRDGPKLRISAWARERNGSPYLSLAVEPRTEAQPASQSVAGEAEAEFPL